MTEVLRTALVERPDERRLEELLERVPEGDRAVMGEDAEIGSDEVVPGDLLVLDGDAEVRGAVKGSVVVVGGSAELKGDAVVHGSMVALGGEVTVPREGRVGGDICPVAMVWLSDVVTAATKEMAAKAAMAAALEAPTEAEAEPEPVAEEEPEEDAEPAPEPPVIQLHGDQVKVLSSYVLGANEEADGDVVLYGGTAVIAGVQRGDVVAIGGSIRVREQGRVVGDVVAIGGNVKLEEGASVEGDATAVGGQLVRAATARVNGRHMDGFCLPPGTRAVSRVQQSLLTGLALALLVLLTVLVVPRHVQAIGGAMTGRPAESITVGLVVLLAVLPLSLLMAITCVLLPAIPLLWLLVAVAALCGCAALSLWVTRVLCDRVRRPLPALLAQAAIGAAAIWVLWLLGRLPYLGVLAWLLLAAGLAWGLGAAITTRLGSRPRIAPTPTPPSEETPTEAG
jgi:hypothetical protein